MKSNRGLTLIELLLSLGVLVVLTGLSLPAWRPLLQDHQGRQVIEPLASHIALARASAIRSGAVVAMCPSSDGESCTDTWEDGHIVFLDPDRNGRPETTDQVLHRTQYLRPIGVLIWKSFQKKSFLQFDQRGFPVHQNGSFTWCPPTPSAGSAQQLVISSGGRVRRAVDRDGDGFVENGAGKPVKC